ncbi:MAG: hypothetical protein J0I19_08170 [Alphaproteobacteria bacterium]|nr:hypothetical protein [Alphaproteobacteria bacterium]
MPRKPKKLTAKQRMTWAGLDGSLAEFYEAECDGTLADKEFENQLYKRRVPAKRRRTTNPSASEIYDASINRMVRTSDGRRMRRIEIKILKLASMAVEDNMEAADMLMVWREKSKRHGDFVLEEEFDRYPAANKVDNKGANKKGAGDKFDFEMAFFKALAGKKKG